MNYDVMYKGMVIGQVYGATEAQAQKAANAQYSGNVTVDPV